MTSKRTHRRALVKTVSWRGLSLVFTTLGVWALTGRPSLAASVGFFEVVIKFGGYYLHERLWDWIDLRGTQRLPIFSWFLSKKEEQQCQQPS